MHVCDSNNLSQINAKALFNALPQAILFLSEENNICASNAAFNTLCGLSSSILEGQPLASLFEHSNDYKKFLDEELPACGALWLKLASGNKVKVVAQRTEFLTEDSITSMLSIYTFTEEGLGSHFVAGITGDGCWIWDVLQSTTWRSPRWLEITGMEREPAKLDSDEVSAKFEFINASERRDAIKKKFMVDTGLAEGEGYLKCADGSRKHISWQGLVVARNAKGEPISSMGSIRDMAPFVARNVEILQARDNIAHQARLLQLGETLATVSHELNQPLSAIASFASVCKRNVNLNAEVVQIISQIETQALRAGTLLRRIRDFAQRGEYDNRTPTSIVPILTDVIDWMKTDWRCRDIHFQFSVSSGINNLDLNVECHRIEIEQIIINLITNAAAAVRSLGNRAKMVDSCDLSISVALIDTNKSIEITVADRGPGLDEALLDTLFTPFTTTRSDGLGLGLSICKNIANELCGTLNYKPRDGGGALFILSLPLSPKNQ